jgi:N6-adenosine-specific RNA methylase IME4
VQYESVKEVPVGQYDLILEDFPWWYENWGTKEKESRGELWGRAKGRSPYVCIPHNEAMELTYSKLAKKDCVRLSWATFPKLQHAMELIHNEQYKVRGRDGFNPVFSYRTIPFVWLKLNKNAYDNYLKSAYLEQATELVYTRSAEELWQYFFTNLQPFFKGSGYYTRANVEILLLSVRGKGLPRLDKSVSQLIITPLKGHSSKPKELYEKIDRLFGTDLKRIELFARKENPPPDTWEATGLEWDGKTIQDFLAEQS